MTTTPYELNFSGLREEKEVKNYAFPTEHSRVAIWNGCELQQQQLLALGVTSYCASYEERHEQYLLQRLLRRIATTSTAAQLGVSLNCERANRTFRINVVDLWILASTGLVASGKSRMERLLLNTCRRVRQDERVRQVHQGFLGVLCRVHQLVIR